MPGLLLSTPFVRTFLHHDIEYVGVDNCAV